MAIHKSSGRPRARSTEDPLTAALNAVTAYNDADLVVAPRRPTREMIVVGARAAGITPEAAATAYRAMIAVAEA